MKSSLPPRCLPSATPTSPPTDAAFLSSKLKPFIEIIQQTNEEEEIRGIFMKLADEGAGARLYAVKLAESTARLHASLKYFLLPSTGVSWSPVESIVDWKSMESLLGQRHWRKRTCAGFPLGGALENGRWMGRASRDPGESVFQSRYYILVLFSRKLRKHLRSLAPTGYTAFSTSVKIFSYRYTSVTTFPSPEPPNPLIHPSFTLCLGHFFCKRWFLSESPWSLIRFAW